MLRGKNFKGKRIKIKLTSNDKEIVKNRNGVEA